jgi:hypothetical protein
MYIYAECRRPVVRQLPRLTASLAKSSLFRKINALPGAD